jgi:dienelactone hydrolase
VKPKHLSILLVALAANLADAQTDPRRLAPLLEKPIQPPGVTASELQHYLIRKVPKLPRISTAESWKAEAKQLRQRVLDSVVFHGWPREWVEAPLKVEDLGLIPSGRGYRIRKLRYEIVPGFYSTALLYEPATIRGKIPAVLNVNGHGNPGKALEYKQKRCINQALRGILALNLEWIFFGELNKPENTHWFGAHLDLVGANAVGLWYLAMRKGLDYLYQHPSVDRSRIGMTGLSGGGWQTIVLSSLDERIKVSIPVAGYSSLISRIERPDDVGDVEQNPTDMLTIVDYPHLTAMRAPRPTLLVYNAEDDCCFRGALVRPHIFDHVRPFFRLFASEDRLAWHLNTDPSDHNYQLDNRQQAYRFFTKHLGLPVADKETPVDAETKSYEELVVGLPEDNLTVLGLAKRLAAKINRPAIPSDDDSVKREWARNGRAKLKATVRFQPVEVERAWAVDNTHNKGLETRSYRFKFTNGLSATAVWLKALSAPDRARGAIVVHDKGKKASSKEVSERLNRGEQVLAIDLLFTGDVALEPRGRRGYTQMLATIGDRPLGVEAAQLIGLARWLKTAFHAPTIRLEASGVRSQTVSLVAAALEPEALAEIVVHDGMTSLRHLLEKPVEFQEAPDLFCLDLYKEFDLDRLAEIAKPTKLIQE